MHRKICVWILAFALCPAVNAEGSGMVKRPDLTIFSALAVGQSARAIGMGGAYTTVGNDINAIWWNPAGIAHMDRMEVAFSHTQWLVNSTFNTGAIGITRGIHSFALGIMSFDPGSVEERTIFQPDGTGRILDLGTVAVQGVYARRFTDKLAFGIRVVWARENLDLTDFSTINIDFGTMFYTGFRSLRLSMALRNFGTDTEVFRREFQQPLNFNLGGAAELYGQEGDPFYLTGSVEMNYAINYTERYHLGGEAWVGNMLALRAGYMINYDGFDFTAGGGLKMPFGERGLSIDFAWQNGKNGMNMPLRFSLGMKL